MREAGEGVVDDDGSEAVEGQRKRSGSARARLLGPSSPSTICPTVARTKPTVSVTPRAAVSPRPTAPSRGANARPRVGSAM